MKILAVNLLLLSLSTGALAQSVGDILKENQDLFLSFFGNEQSSVVKEAQELAKVVKTSKAPELDAVKKNLKPLLNISKSNSKEKNLDLYGNFLPPLVNLIKSGKYKQYSSFYCPMVKKRWIQDVSAGSAVKNVFAQDMLGCGGKE